MTAHVTHQTYSIDGLIPVQVFQILPKAKKYLLESSFPHEDKGRYSFIGLHPYQEIIGRGKETMLISTSHVEPLVVHQHALHFLQEIMPKLELPIPLPFYGGAVGYIGYDTIQSFEDIGPTPLDDRGMPDIHLMLFEDTIIFDHEQGELHIIAIDRNGGTEDNRKQRIEILKQYIDQAKNTSLPVPQKYAFTPEIEQSIFEENVEIAKGYLKRGEIFQVVLSQRFSREIEEDERDFGLSFYEQLRRQNASPYMFYIDFLDYTLLGASPESLIQTKGTRVITNPIAGTRKRGQNEQEDQLLGEELLADEKERAEHRMLVDLSRNDLGRVCEIGSIEIPVYMTIERYQHVMHIVSEVAGRLRADYSGIDALISCLPAGTVSGAPKIRAMQIINELETVKRGPYGGGVGFINFEHDVLIALAIRTIIIQNQRAYFQSGAGIVYDSIPFNEYMESLNKGKSFMEVPEYDSINR
ncbi:anthranilate synthase component I [Oceanobacillus sp. J11TS1]|uniref:anthranilate synthase component I n=1 Tax=Oceanobacillus sp. J11TS1 TaxID=2807191 RepID=UPI001B2B0C60|nr:anthranilate synthase component I [Oceanobacillus sp. J11TS1]GIO23257.1 anthranilate synthase component I [Oceanobacillus sp. J11TS1]